jgi:hypothetical protein
MSWGVITLDLFVETNASYFMNELFLHSGLFVPRSMDKEVLYNCSIEKIKQPRVLIVVYYFLIGPNVENGFALLFFGLSYPGILTPTVT